MNICILTHAYPLKHNESRHGGTFTVDFARTLKDRGHKVFIFSPDIKGEKDTGADISVMWFKWRGVDIDLGQLKLCRPDHLLKVLSLIFSGRKQILKFIRENKIDFCFALWGLPSGYFAYFANKRLNVPYCVWSLGSDIWLFNRNFIANRILKRVFKDAMCLFADGFALADDVKKISGRKCEFLPTSRKLPIQGIDTAKVDGSKLNLLYIGRWHPNKGIDILIDAFHMVLEKFDNLHLYIFGGGPLGNLIKRKISRYNIGERVSLEGYINGPTVVSYLKACDCLIIPSRIESIPIILSDAAQTKIPVIATDTGDLGKLVKDFSIGEVAKAGDVDSLKAAIERFILKGKDSYIIGNNMDKLTDILDIERSAERFLLKVGEYVT